MATFRLTADHLTPFDFLAGAVVIKEGWTIGETLTENWEFIGAGSPTILLAEIAELNALLSNAREWAVDPLRYNPTWLELQTDDEGPVRRRLVLDGGRGFLNRTGINPLLTNQRIALDVSLEFAYPWWEEQTETTVYNDTISCLGGTVTIPLGGDMDGRISRIRLDNLVDPGLMTQFWIGIRQVYDGTSDLVNVWSCSLGSNGTDASNTADSDCVSGNRKTITFGTTTLAKRTAITYDDLIGASDSTHLRGRYLVLLRYKLPTSSSAVNLQMRYGFSGDTKAIQEDVIVTTGGSGMSTYGVVELGMVQFPPGIPRGKITDLSECEIDIYAERITGTTHLYLAELLLIPADHLLRITGASVGPSTGDLETNIYTHEDEEVSSFGYDLLPNVNARPEPENWRLPYQEDSVLILVGALSATELREADTITLSLYAHYCWQNYTK